MLPVDRIVREIKVSLEGLKRGITEIALDVDENMQIMKLTLHISDLEKKMEKAFIQLGHTTCQMDGNSMDELSSHPDVKSLYLGIRDFKQQISGVEMQVEGLRDDLLRERLSELRINLRRKGGIIEELVLLPGSSWVGRKVADLALDPKVILVTLIREPEMIYPRGETVLLEGDRLYLIGPRQQVYGVIEASQPPEGKLHPPSASP